MVNMNKWEEIDYFDAKVGDTLKRVGVWTLTVSETKGKVTQTEFGFLNGGSYTTGRITIRRNGETKILRRDLDGPPRGVKIYRRRPVVAPPFNFPTGTGAIIEGQGRNGKVNLVHLGAGMWFSLVNTGTYGQATVEATLKNLRVLTPGIPSA